MDILPCTNSEDPDQTVHGAVWSRSSLIARYILQVCLRIVGKTIKLIAQGINTKIGVIFKLGNVDFLPGRG